MLFFGVIPSLLGYLNTVVKLLSNFVSHYEQEKQNTLISISICLFVNKRKTSSQMRTDTKRVYTTNDSNI